jgi:hypothetical protein
MDDIIKHFKKELGINIRKVEFIKENDPFKAILGKLEDFFSQNIMESLIRYETMEINSLVESKRDFYTLKQHPCVTLILLDGSHLRFSPDNKNGIELTRVYINDKKRRNGLGSSLMNIFLSLCKYALGHLPDISLECTGVVGFGEYQTNTPLNIQIKFFESFGFKVKKRNKGGYVQMEFKGGEES